ncbi:MAG TPA: hypothetical protein DCE78_03445 [Bacteroidetes bacterium]|nr:hypothetical protein [Bacteroidota bacterium]
MRRHSELTELMDDPDCDVNLLKRTYHLFPYVNRLFSQWSTIYRLEIKPHLQDRNHLYTLLDVGSGLMDNSFFVQKLATNDGFKLKITGIDPNPMVSRLIEEKSLSSLAEFKSCYLHDLDEAKKFDFIISNHLLHHLQPSEVKSILAEIQSRTKIKAIMNDIHRSRIAWCAFGVIMSPFRFGSFIQRDGLTSIKKSYTSDEMLALATEDWRIRKLFPYRYSLIYDNH